MFPCARLLQVVLGFGQELSLINAITIAGMLSSFRAATGAALGLPATFAFGSNSPVSVSPGRGSGCAVGVGVAWWGN